MKRPDRTIARLLIAFGLALVLTVLVLGTLRATGEPAPANGEVERDQLSMSVAPGQGALPAVALPLAQPGTVSIVKVAETDAENNSIIRNGGTITYIITITNEGPQPATDLTILDIPTPLGTLNLVRCISETYVTTCTQVIQTVGPITVTRQITWSLDLLEGGRTKTFTYTGRVACQPDRAIFTNYAFVSYQQHGAAQWDEADPVTTTVRSRAQQGIGSGISEEPSWCSDERGNGSVDWGDFDLDGDLDVALGSYEGVTVYRNDDGQLTQFWSDDYEAYAVRWADLDNDGRLELISVGEYDWAAPPLNYIYQIELGQTSFFTSEIGSIDVLEIADYDGDGYLDLAAEADWEAGVGCQIRLYRNDQTGDFPPADRTCIYDGDYPETMAWGDYDNDGDPDLAIGAGNYYSGTYLQIFENEGGNFTDSFIATLYDEYVYGNDIAWGDYNNDGFLDLAVSSLYTVSVYRNSNGSWYSWNLADQDLDPPPNFFSTGSADWADFDGDGRLDLAVTNVPIRIYQHDDAAGPWSNFSFSEMTMLPDGAAEGYYSTWSDWTYFYLPDVRGIDYDNDGDLDLAFGNAYGRSLIFDNVLAPLRRTLTTIVSPSGNDTWSASSVAWGDIDRDEDLDLLFGAGSSSGGIDAFGNKLYENDYYDHPWDDSQDALFPHSGVDTMGTFGPSSLAFGDVDGNGELDIAIGSRNGQVTLYQDSNETPVFKFPENSDSLVAWADADFDGDLDLLVGNDGANALFVNDGGQLSASPVWTSVAADTRSIAWAYYDDDFYPDFAVGNFGQPTRVYRNNQDNTFTPVWTLSTVFSTTSVAWADYDGDGDMDLAVGNYGQANYIYRYDNGNLGQTPAWSSTETSRTTSLAWGDWDNDGDLDLAVGNDGEPDQVYANEPGSPPLSLRWFSAETYGTTGVAWGDQDNDGDLDLAVSSADGNGVYENLYVSPAHLFDDNFAKMMTLPNNPSYVSVARPGRTAAADFFSSPEILSGATTPVVTIAYRLFDPDGSRDNNERNAFGDQVVRTLYQFSEDGGGIWQDATPAAGWLGPETRTSRLGQEATFLWDATTDGAISHNARFRITVMQGCYHSGSFQRASTSAVSPPFRVMGLSCLWPTSPRIDYVTSDGRPPRPNVPINFTGSVIQGSGVLTFTWNFGDGSPVKFGQLLQHTYTATNIYTVTLTVNGEPCPITEPVSTTEVIRLGSAFTRITYLPIVQKAGVGGPSVTIQGPNLTIIPGAPAQVTGLWGSTQLDAGVTRLAWSPNRPDDAVLGYRIYRSSIEAVSFQLLADVPATATTYTDDAATCGQMYLVTAYNAEGESLPSAATYFSPPCQ